MVSLCTLVVAISAPTQALPAQLFREIGFEKLTVEDGRLTKDRSEHLLAVRTYEGLTISLNVQKIEDAVDAYSENDLHGEGEQVPTALFVHPIPSRTPLGVCSAWIERQNTFYGKAVGRFEKVWSLMYFQPPRSDESPRQLEDEHKLLAERVIRLTLARAAGIRLIEPTSMTLSGRSVAARIEKHSRVQSVKLDDWAAARGWSARWNAQTSTTAMSKGGRVVLVPAGSRQIKIGYEWVETGDVIALVDNATYVRLPALESLSNP